jgi:hypothetical protein
MTQKIVSGNDIIYSLVSINPADTEFLKESNTKHHQFVGFV